ncbi:MAG: OsmC family protein [Ancalomicrobiaceae bacterium]|nr:OsmC family protein [Ancalomicrobiaceae bacterium]
MADLKLRQRATGATAVVVGSEKPHVTSDTNGEMDLATSVSEPGFNPLDLLYASLAACLAISARMAAQRMGIADRLMRVSAHVGGEKAKDGLSRVARFDIDLTIEGDFDEATRRAIAEAAENEICTVSNTIRGNPDFNLVVHP